jgi:hypothetical protein
MRELAHIDPDGNLLLSGSPLREDPLPQPVPGPVAGQDPGAAHDPSVFEFTAALRTGDEARLRVLLAADPGLATSLINSRTPRHLFAGGTRPEAAGHRARDNDPPPDGEELAIRSGTPAAPASSKRPLPGRTRRRHQLARSLVRRDPARRGP